MPQGSRTAAPRVASSTAGLVASRNAAGEFLDRSVYEQAATTGSLTAALDRLVELVDRHTEGRHDDDLALLGLEYDPREQNGR